MKNRTPEQIKEHYKLETQLADKLRHSTWDERKHLYPVVYDEFISKLNHLPQLNLSPEAIKAKVRFEMIHLKPYLKPETIYLELGAGECALAREVSVKVNKVFIGEVSTEMINKADYPEKFEFILTDGREVDLPDASVDVVYSHQLMEHIHPDDAIEQLKSILRVLKPGGVYICVTPNRLSGPHDISKYFDEEAKGFHLKEYTVTELSNLFQDTGFSRVRAYSKFKRLKIFWPNPVYKLAESMLGKMGFKSRKKITRNAIIGNLLIVNVIGVK